MSDKLPVIPMSEAEAQTRQEALFVVKNAKSFVIAGLLDNGIMRIHHHSASKAEGIGLLEFAKKVLLESRKPLG